MSIAEFLAGSTFAVVGASKDRTKYGNKVLRCYLQHGRTVYPVHPAADVIEGLPVYANLESLPGPVDGVSIITPPAVTATVVDDAIRLGIRRLWMQPGAEHPAAIEKARAHGIDVIADGPCLLVALGYRE